MDLVDLEQLVGLSESAAYGHLEGLGDGLPVASASSALLHDMVAACGLDAEAVITSLMPLREPLTVRQLAICAALAGCEPMHVPVLVAAFRAFGAAELNSYGFLTTTGSAAPLILVNGPMAGALGFSGGSNCLGPGSRANATVGRCVSLAVRLIGGARQGVADMATLGQPAKYTCCFAENESMSPWPPFHVGRGFDADDSTVTVTAISGIVETFEASTGLVHDMLDSLSVVLAGSAPTLDLGRSADPLVGGGQPMVIVTPEWATQFHRSGLTKSELQIELFDRAVRIGADGSQLRVARSPDDILVVVAGGVGVKQAIVPNWNGGSRAVTVALADKGVSSS